jgi:hypothetical protein
MFVLPFRIRVFATKTQNRNGLGAELFRRANDIGWEKQTPGPTSDPGVLRDDCKIVSPLMRNANPALAPLSPVQAGMRDFSTASVSVETQLFRAVGRIALANPPP